MSTPAPQTHMLAGASQPSRYQLRVDGWMVVPCASWKDLLKLVQHAKELGITARLSASKAP